MSELKEVFEMVTKQTEPDVDAWRDQERRQRRKTMTRKVGAFALAAAIGIAAVVLQRIGRRRGSAEASAAHELVRFEL